MEEPDTPVVASPRRTRRRFSPQFKARLVKLATNGEHSVSQVAIDHQLNANVLRKWIRQANAPAGAGAMVAVRVAEEPPRRSVTSAPCVLELTLHDATLRFFHGFDPMAVAALLKAAR